MRYAPALLTLAFLATGCHKNTGENSQEPVDNPSYRDGGQTPDTETSSGDKATLAPSQENAGPQAQGDAQRAAVESCVDRWLQAHKLDRYGHPEGTMYAGGTPLFNEATGETKDRLEYVFERQPEARKACAAKGAQ